MDNFLRRNVIMLRYEKNKNKKQNNTEGNWKSCFENLSFTKHTKNENILCEISCCLFFCLIFHVLLGYPHLGSDYVLSWVCTECRSKNYAREKTSYVKQSPSSNLLNYKRWHLCKEVIQYTEQRESSTGKWHNLPHILARANAKNGRGSFRNERKHVRRFKERQARH